MKSHNKNTRKILSMLVALIFLVSGCSPSTTLTKQPAQTLIPSPTKLIVTKTPSPPIPKIEVASTPTAQAAVELSLEPECIPVEENVPEDLVLSGVWVRAKGKPYLENLNEHVKYGVPLRGGGILSTYPNDMAMSPDGKHLAYIDSYIETDAYFDSTIGFQRRILRTQKRILRIINSAGHSLPMNYWTADWQRIVGWIDNENLALSFSLSYKSDLEFIVLNPFTGSWKKYEQPEWLKDNYPRWFFYIPTLDWLIDYSNSPQRVLKDVKTGNIIWQTDQEGGFTWSSDGSTVLVNSANFIDMISKEGQAVKYDIRKLEMKYLDNLALSSNGKKLLFSAYYPERYFILDAKKSIIRELCKNDYQRTFINNPFWSPDNRFVVLSVYESEYYSGYDPFDLLIDTEQLHAYKLVTKHYNDRLAWLTQP